MKRTWREVAADRIRSDRLHKELISEAAGLLDTFSSALL
jgi:hypothetical protein